MYRKSRSFSFSAKSVPNQNFEECIEPQKEARTQPSLNCTKANCNWNFLVGSKPHLFQVTWKTLFVHTYYSWLEYWTRQNSACNRRHPVNDSTEFCLGVPGRHPTDSKKSKCTKQLPEPVSTLLCNDGYKIDFKYSKCFIAFKCICRIIQHGQPEVLQHAVYSNDKPKYPKSIIEVRFSKSCLAFLRIPA